MAIVPWRARPGLSHIIEEEGIDMPGEEEPSISLYSILQVAPDATPEQLKKQRRKLALRYHPDKNYGDDAANASEKMQQINRAYEILSDPTRRQVYDMFGEEAVEMVSNGSVSEGIAKFLLLLVSPKLPFLVAGVCLLAFLILLACPLFIALRLENTVDWNWFVAFLPLLLLTGVAAVTLTSIDILLIYVGIAVPKDDESDDEERQGERDSFLDEDGDDTTYRSYTMQEAILLLANGIPLAGVFVFEVLLCLRLDDYVAWSWWVVFFPLLVALGVMVAKAIMNHPPSVYEHRNRWRAYCRFGYPGFLLRNCNTTAMLFATALLFVINLEYGSGEGDLGVSSLFSWWYVMLPVFVWALGGMAVCLVENFCPRRVAGEAHYRRALVHWREMAVAEQQGEERDTSLDDLYGSPPSTLGTALSIGYNGLVFGFLLTVACLAAAWLSSGTMSGIVLFLPFFIALCCLGSVCFCCALPFYAYLTCRMAKPRVKDVGAEEAGMKYK
mmetsp:Transcript_15921/g.62209  ORF Transcript_15921/g.62209 Transcript_15921/m.62209 type:complete len:499 (+) Transcript_15921:12-1508(+)